MSNILPASAPTPPVTKCEKKRFSLLKSEKNSKQPMIEECLWSLEYPELQKACFLAKICAERPPQKCELHNIGSIQQVGPTCGLTAVSMLLGGIPPTEQLLEDAKQKHFTNNGEMFSALQLYQMICYYLPMINNNNNNNENNLNSKQNAINAIGTSNEEKPKKKQIEAVECQIHEGRLNCVKVRESLQNGAYLFVPYPFQTDLLYLYYKWSKSFKNV